LSLVRHADRGCLRGVHGGGRSVRQGRGEAAARPRAVGRQHGGPRGRVSRVPRPGSADRRADAQARLPGARTGDRTVRTTFMKAIRVPAVLAAGLLSLLTACGGGDNGITGPTEITVTEITVGTGATAAIGDVVSVHYVLTVNGTKLDSSYDRGTPLQPFQIGAGAVIPGFERGVLGMRVGGKRHVVVPPALGYGSQPNGPIPANSNLDFDIEL